MKRKNEHFGDGIVKVYSVTNIAQPGDEPKDGITLKLSMRYRAKTVGFKRYYEAMQAQVQVDRMILVRKQAGVSPQDVCVVDGEQYKIVQVQHLTEEKPELMLISMQRLEAAYDIA